METLIGILVGGTIGVFALRMAFDDWFKRARLRKALAQGDTQPALSDDAAPPELARLGLTEPFRVGETVGGRGTIAGVVAEGALELVAGEDFEVRKYLLTLRVSGLSLFTEGMRKTRGDVETGDAELDGLFVIQGPLELVAARLDLDARRALIAAAAAGWRGRGESLACAGVRELDLKGTLDKGLEAARRLLPGYVEARLERTATADPVMRMRRLALATLVSRHPAEAATRRVVEAAQRSADPIIRWLAMTPSPIDAAWVRVASNLLLDSRVAVEVAALLVWLDVVEALPGLGRAAAELADGPAKDAVAAARLALAARAAARGQGATGALALSERDAGQLSLDD
ncbi:MAG: hypothetical protein IT385_03560 [Deltaproteobacteria bacterium]|nr:hypothetical protein [Deltaproteobacteria bacterium]